MHQRHATPDAPRVRICADPHIDVLAQARGIANSPKGLLRDYLKDRKNPGRHSERDILDAMDRLGQLPGDKEAEDILYALSDIAPSDAVRRKARDILAGRSHK